MSNLTNIAQQINDRARDYRATGGDSVRQALWAAANELGFEEIHRTESGEGAIYRNQAGELLNCYYLGPQSDEITEGGAGFDDEVSWYTGREGAEDEA